MELIKRISRLILPLITLGGLASSAIAAGEGSFRKPMQIFRFKTPQMVLYVNSTISLLNSEENPNKRHLNNLLKCQKLFSSGKKLIRGMEIKSLKVCKQYMDLGLYQTSSVTILENELEILKELIKSNKENLNSIEREKNQTERQYYETLKEKSPQEILISPQEKKLKKNSNNEITKDNPYYEEERLIKLKDIFEKGLISESEYKKLRLKTLGL